MCTPPLAGSGDTLLVMAANTALCHVPMGTVFQLDDTPPQLPPSCLCPFGQGFRVR